MRESSHSELVTLLGRRKMLIAGVVLPALFMPATMALSFTEAARNIESFADAWARALSRSNDRLVEVVLPKGRFMIDAPPGSPMAGYGPVPAVRHRHISIRGAGVGQTILVATPRRAASFSDIEISGAVLRSIDANYVELSGLTFDGGLQTVKDKFGRTGPIPDATAMVEIRGAAQVVLRDIAFTGFAGHWDTSAPERGSDGSRGPLLVAECGSVRATGLTLHMPSFREGLFFFNIESLLIERFRYLGPNVGRGVSTPLHVLGALTDKVVICGFRATGDWGGSLINLAGSGDLLINDLDARGISPDQAMLAFPRNGGIDFGGEINDLRLGQRGTRSVTLQNVMLRNIGKAAINGRRRPDCPLARLVLRGDIVVESSSQALSLSYVGMVAGAMRASSIGQQARPDGRIQPAVYLHECGGGSLQLVLTPNVATPTTGIYRERSSGLVIGGSVSGFAAGLTTDHVNPGDDAQFDARFRDMAFADGRIVVGVGSKRRVRLAKFEACTMDGRPISAADISELDTVDVRFY